MLMVQSIRLLTNINMILTPYNKQVLENKPLVDLLPMEIPFTMWVEPTNTCNFRCIFCPTGNKSLLSKVVRPAGFMDYDLYLKIIKDIIELCKKYSGRLHRLHLYKDGEPLLHDKIDLMVLNAKKINLIDSVEITTNASLLTKDLSSRLIVSGLDSIRISIEHVNDNEYRKITKSAVDYETIRSNVEFLFQEKVKQCSKLHIHTKIIDTGLSEEEKNKFLSDFSGISDSINIDNLMGWSKSFEKEICLDLSKVEKGMSGIATRNERKVCPEPFTKLAVNFNGTVSVCCADWSHGTLVGDLKEENLLDIWNGEKLKSLRMLHLSGKREQIPSCCNCDYMKGFPEFTNLDRFSDTLIDKYKYK